MHVINKSKELTKVLLNNSQNQQAGTQNKLIEVPSNFLSDFIVRWNTTYLMLERFYVMKAIVDEMTCNPQIINGITYKQEQTLHGIILSHEDWENIAILIKLLKPFSKASTMLQRRKFETLALSKAIESILFKAFDQFLKSTNAKELTLATALNDYLQRHLDFKISEKQKKASSVCQS